MFVSNLVIHVDKKVFDDVYHSPDKPFVNLISQVVCWGSKKKVETSLWYADYDRNNETMVVELQRYFP